MKKIFKMLKPFKGTLIAAIIFSALYSLLQILLPVYTKEIMSKGIIAGDMNEIIRYGLIMLGLTLIGVATSILNTYFSTKTSVNYAMNIRNQVFTKVSYLAQSDVDKIGVSSLMTRTTNDVVQVHNFILSAMKSILPVPIMLIGGLVMAHSVNAKLLKLILIVIPVLLVILIVILIFIMPMYSKIQKLLDQINFVMRGKIGGIRVIRAFNKTKYEDDRFDDANGKLTKLSLKASRIMYSLLPILMIFAFGLIAYIIYMCVMDATKPGVGKQAILDTIPNMYMFLAYFTMIISAISTAMTLFVSWPKANISAKRISEILDSETEIKDPENPVEPDPEIKGEVEFDNVSFRYKPIKKEEKKKRRRAKSKPSKNKSASAGEENKSDENNGKKEENTSPDEKVTEEEKEQARKKAEIIAADAEKKKKLTDRDAVHDVSFVSHKGEYTAVIGITGCGKSSLINLIPRLYDVTSGSVKIDGVDVRCMKAEHLHKKIAYIPQQSYLFSGTVRDNIKFGNPDATDAQVWKALEIAQAKTFVSEMPEGLDSQISQSGKNLSGGQKQRLCIARAIVKNAEIYLFDDSFSALDLATDARLRSSLRANLPDADIFIVAQRVGTVINADRIIVMDDGRAVGIGTHKELIETCGVYRDIVASQVGLGNEEAVS